MRLLHFVADVSMRFYADPVNNDDVMASGPHGEQRELLDPSNAGFTKTCEEWSRSASLRKQLNTNVLVVDGAVRIVPLKCNRAAADHASRSFAPASPIRRLGPLHDFLAV